jgi:glycosyltransferase involved in cell wall biosynthesis
VFDSHGALADELAATGHLRAGGRLHRLAQSLEGWLERRADAVIAQSEHRAATIAAHGVDPRRISVCPDGPEAAVLDILPSPGPRSITCLYTGSLNRYQGLDDILQAARHTPGVEYVIFGSPAGHYPELARTLGVAGRVEFVDPAPLSALPGRLAGADIALAPRRYGGNIPGKLPIYQAAGLPVVGTEVPGVTELVGEDTGAVVPPGDPGALAAAINRLAADPQLRRRQGAAAREQARRRYAPEMLRGSLEAAYRSATA